MRRIGICFFAGLLLLGGTAFFSNEATGAEKREGYLLLGDVKEGWKVFVTKKCSACHSIWGEGGKGGPDLGTLPESHVSQAQLAALIWNHLPEMWGRMMAKKIPLEKIDKKGMADLFAFLYFIRYMDEPGDPRKGKGLMEMKNCSKCHTVGEETKGDFSHWGTYANSILWAEMMWNHAPQMEQQMRKRGIPWVEFKGNEMVDLIAYIRSFSAKSEKIYLSPGDPASGEKLFTKRGCVRCHASGSELDLAKKKEFPRTLAQLAGMMWNHSYEMRKRMEEKGMERPLLSSQEMTDLVAYLFSIRYFDEPGNPNRGRAVFVKGQCNVCHAKGSKKFGLSTTERSDLPHLHGPGHVESWAGDARKDEEGQSPLAEGSMGGRWLT